MEQRRPEWRSVIDGRRRTPDVEADLGHWGGHRAPDPLPATRTAAAAIAAADDLAILGMLYVSEGSSNGGRFLTRSAARAWNLAPGRPDGLRTLDPYGEDQPVRWAAIKTALGALDLTVAARHRIRDGALAMFLFVGGSPTPCGRLAPRLDGVRPRADHPNLPFSESPMRSIVLLLAGLALAGCAASPETPQQADLRMTTESAAARKVLDSLNAEFISHFNAGHGDLVAAQYADDGELMIGGAPVAKGRAAIAAAVNGLVPLKATIKFATTSVSANGPIAVERGTYLLTIQPPGAPGPLSEEGNFVVHWHRSNGQWLRIHDIAASPKPVPPPPEPAPARTK